MKPGELYVTAQLYESLKYSNSPASQHAREEYIRLLEEEGSLESISKANDIRAEKMIVFVQNISKKVDTLQKGFENA